jgi:HK97 family phage major capsid protein
MQSSQARIERRLIKRDLIKRGLIRGARLDATAGIAEIQASIKSMHEALKARDGELATNWAKAEAEIKSLGTMTNETKAALTKIATEGSEVQARILNLEQTITALKTATANDNRREPYSPGKAFTADATVKAFLDSGGRIGVKQRFSAPVNTITSLSSGDGGAGDLIVPQRIPGIIEQRFRKLRVRDLLPVGRTSSNSLEFVQESGFTNSAAPVAEGALKPESSISFDLQTAPVRTIAHYMIASVQILADVPQLQSFIDTRLRIGLAIEEEDQILSGDGTGQNLLGLIPQATDFDTTRKRVGDYADRYRPPGDDTA